MLLKELVIIFFVLWLLLNLIKKRIEPKYRILQLPITLIACLVMLLMIVFYQLFYEQITQWLAATRINLTAQGGLIGQGARSIYAFFQNGSLFVLNILLLLAFLAIRALSSVWAGKRERNLSDLDQIFKLSFYDYDVEDNRWFVSQSAKNMARLIYWVYFFLAAFFMSYLLSVWFSRGESLPWLNIYPGALLAALAGLYGYLDGQTKEAFDQAQRKASAKQLAQANYSKIESDLVQVLSSPYLGEVKEDSHGEIESNEDYLERLSQSNKKSDRITADYFLSEYDSESLDLDYIKAAADLMDHKNVIFLDPFYQDLDPYLILPLAQCLLEGKKALVVISRHSHRKAIQAWIQQALDQFILVNNYWKVKRLKSHTDQIRQEEIDVGLVTFCDIYDKKVLQNNQAFLNECAFVVLMEPSAMLSTGQAVFHLLSRQISLAYPDKPVYCIIDRQSDGLVDTLSHLINAEIVDVAGQPVSRGSNIGLIWDVDEEFRSEQLFSSQTRYYGNGLEIAAIALQNDVPKVNWYSNEKAPVRDIRWISAENYLPLTEEMNLPRQQESINQRIGFHSHLWDARKEKESFLVVEDEFSNAFATIRLFLSRGMDQSFVNVLSGNYLLRDYMIENSTVFASNPSAIPNIVPAYANTKRNTILKLIMMMEMGEVTERQILQEFELAGIKTEEIEETLNELAERYTVLEAPFTTNIPKTSQIEYIETAQKPYTVIRHDLFEKQFARTLKPAFFIAEEEKNETETLDARLYNHVTQLTLPGQYLVYDGKYYLTKSIDPETGVILERASDLYQERQYYRQMRAYKLGEVRQTLSKRRKGHLWIEKLEGDFDVETYGYLLMKDQNNLLSARVVDFRADPNAQIYSRHYRNKTYLRLTFDGLASNQLKTIALLLSEAFKTFFPDGWPYLAVMVKTEIEPQNKEDYLLYGLEEPEEFQNLFEQEGLYILEDSELDLGLLEAVEKNLEFFLQRITDYLSWYLEPKTKVRDVSPDEDELIINEESPEIEEEIEENPDIEKSPEIEEEESDESKKSEETKEPDKTQDNVKENDQKIIEAQKEDIEEEEEIETSQVENG